MPKRLYENGPLMPTDDKSWGGSDPAKTMRTPHYDPGSGRRGGGGFSRHVRSVVAGREAMENNRKKNSGESNGGLGG